MAEFTVYDEETAPGTARPMLVTASVANECAYCVAAHSTMALRANLAPDTVAALRAGKPLDDRGWRRYVPSPERWWTVAAGWTTSGSTRSSPPGSPAATCWTSSSASG
jgi:AhpD family alkylhydroperoxidase